ncbi:hypothetical protein BC835DRAFT_57570 [Cytidiella melzeri]|nr:hypothetical protein BC835DRAFT_57570 [Cytidiella melzeri]
MWFPTSSILFAIVITSAFHMATVSAIPHSNTELLRDSAFTRNPKLEVRIFKRWFVQRKTLKKAKAQVADLTAHLKQLQEAQSAQNAKKEQERLMKLRQAQELEIIKKRLKNTASADPRYFARTWNKLVDSNYKLVDSNYQLQSSIYTPRLEQDLHQYFKTMMQDHGRVPTLRDLGIE